MVGRPEWAVGDIKTFHHRCTLYGPSAALYAVGLVVQLQQPDQCVCSDLSLANHHHHIFVYSVVVTRNSSHRDKIRQSLKIVHKQYKYNCQLTELIAVFVQHSYEKVSMVKFGCLVE